MFDRPLFRPAGKAIVDAAQAIVVARGVSMATVAMAWVLHNPGVTAPIIGATKPKHLADAAAALELRLSDEEIVALEQPYTPRLGRFVWPYLGRALAFLHRHSLDLGVPLLGRRHQRGIHNLSAHGQIASRLQLVVEIREQGVERDGIG